MKKVRVSSLSMNVVNFLKTRKYPEEFNIFQHDDGSDMSAEQALTFLTLEKAKGRVVIPCSSECSNPCKHANRGCTGFDYNAGGCPGREIAYTADNTEEGGSEAPKDRTE